MDHSEELEKNSPLLLELQKSTAVCQNLPSDKYFDQLHQETLEKISRKQPINNFNYLIKIAALVSGVVFSVFYWMITTDTSQPWQENLAQLPADDLNLFLEYNAGSESINWGNYTPIDGIPNHLFQSLTEEDIESFLNYTVSQINQLELYNTLNSQL